MLTQATLFPARVAEPNASVKPADRKRLRGQNRKLLLALREREMTAREITIDLNIGNHSGRISDLRAAGCVVTAIHEGGGVYRYRLDYCPDGLGGGE